MATYRGLTNPQTGRSINLVFTYHQETEPSTSVSDEGDLWFKKSGDGTFIGTYRYDGSDWVLLVGDDLAAAIADISDFNNSNNQNADAITTPTIASDGTAIDHTVQTDGSSTVSFEWSWAGTEADIDGFIVYRYESNSATSYTFGTDTPGEIAFTCPADRRAAIISGLPTDKYHTFGIRAYRRVDTNIDAAGILVSSVVQPSLGAEDPYQPSSTVAFGGDITGTLDGSPVATVVSNATDGNYVYVNGGDLLYINEAQVNALAILNGPAEAGADVTGNNTAADTTLVNGVAASTITTGITNFNNSNDQNGDAITAPTIAADGTAIDHVIATDGSADMSFEWSWGGTEADIDGFIVYLRQSTSATSYNFGTTPAEETVFLVDASKRAAIWYGMPANKYYTYGVQAFRRVDTNVNVNGIILSTLVQPALAGEDPYQPSTSVTFGGDITGTVNSVAVATITSAVTDFNNSNNQNGSAITTPTISGSGTAIDHTIADDGSANISFEWSWGGTEADIDGFLVYYRQSTSATSYNFGTTPAEEQVFVTSAVKRAFIMFGVPANQYYTFGIQAFRRVDTNVDASGIILSTLVQPALGAEDPYQPSSSVAFAGNVTGTLDGTAVGTVVTNASDGATFTSTDAGGAAYLDEAQLNALNLLNGPAEANADVTDSTNVGTAIGNGITNTGGGVITGTTINTAGTVTTSVTSIGAGTLNVLDTTDFSSSGSGVLVPNTSNQDGDAFSWTGKTATTLTGCTGIGGAWVAGSAVLETQGIVFLEGRNELCFVGTAVTNEELLGTIGKRTSGTDDVIALFGTDTASNEVIGVKGISADNFGVMGVSDSVAGVYGTSTTGPGIHGVIANSGAYGVYGENTASGGQAVRGASGSTGIGVQGYGQYGGIFERHTSAGTIGGQIRLVPWSNTTKPTTSDDGSIFIDSNEDVFLRRASAWAEFLCSVGTPSLNGTSGNYFYIDIGGYQYAICFGTTSNITVNSTITLTPGPTFTATSKMWGWGNREDTGVGGTGDAGIWLNPASTTTFTVANAGYRDCKASYFIIGQTA